MNFIRLAIENPVKVAVSVILIVLFGLLSALNMKVQLIPDVDRPVIVVNTNWSGASPQEIETEIIERQEDKLKNVTGLWKMTSTCSNNTGQIKLEFPVGIDKDTAYRDVSDKLRQVTGYPDEVDEPTMSATDADMEKVIAWLMFYSEDGKDVSHLKTFVEDNVKPILERAEGISEVSVYGGVDREMQVELDPYKLAARRLTVHDVETALQGQNKNISAGTIQLGKRDYSYRTIGEYTSAEEIAQTVIAYQPGGPVKVSDVATVIDGYRKPVSFVRSKGYPVLALPARRETGANVIKAMDNLKQQVDLVNHEILAAKGLHLELTQVYDETVYIWSSIFLVLKNIVVGGALAVAVLLLFLRSGSATGVIAVAIPISVIGTMLVVVMLGRSLNVVLLAGMAFAVGMVVDNAIVVLENIYRHRSMGKDMRAAALDGTAEVWGAVLASTLTTMAVFLPVITMQDESGQLFKDIAIAISSAVGLSLLVSVLVIPPLAARFFRAKNARLAGDKPWWFGRWVGGIVEWVNRGIGRRAATIVGLTTVSVVASYWLMPDTEYLPAGNKNLILGFLITPPGYSVDEFERMAKAVENGDPNNPNDGVRPMWEAKLGTPQAKNLPPVQIAVGAKGDDIRTITPPPLDNFFFVSYDGGAFMGGTSQDDNDVSPLATALSRAGSRLPGVFTMFTQASLFSSGASTGGSTIDLEVRGDRLPDVVAAAVAIQGKVMQEGYGHPRSTPQNFDLGRPEIRLVPDRAKASDLGLDVRDIGYILRACVDGAYVDDYNNRGDRIDLVLKMTGTKNSSLNDISHIPIYTPSGHVVPLAAAVKFEDTTAPQQITRIEEMPSVTLTIKPKTGVPLQATMRDLNEDVVAPLRAQGRIPEGVITSLAGSADKLTETQRALIGDFRGLLTEPRLFDLSAPTTIGLLCVLALIVAGLLFVLVGPSAGILAAKLLALALFLGVCVLNIGFAAMLFQSRAILALLVTYLLMAALFESFIYPFVIMFSVPFAAVGGFLFLALVHWMSLHDVSAPIQQLDVLTMLGFVILIGIVVNNAILIVHQALNFMRDEGMSPRAAVRYSVETRTRPIFMSSLTSVFGMFPLVVMPGAGSELYRGLGSVVLGGLLVSTVFTLVLVPAAFTLLLDAQAWLARAIQVHEAASGVGGAVPAPGSAPRSPDAS